MAEALQDQTMVDEMLQKLLRARQMEIGKDANLMSKSELASSCLNTEKLTEINNAYYVLKKLPSSTGLKLKLEIQKRSQKI
jgi:hypothetical protein